jgi:thioredoxin 1
MGLFDKLFNRPPKPGRPKDLTDEEFAQEVISSSLPAVVSFYSSRCSHCHVMTGLLNEIGPDYIDRVAVFKMNVEHSQQTAAKFKIMKVPTVVFIRDQKVVDTVVGLIPIIPLREKFDRLARIA